MVTTTRGRHACHPSDHGLSEAAAAYSTSTVNASRLSGKLSFFPMTMLIQTSTGYRHMYLRMPVETTAIRVDGAEEVTGFTAPVFGRHTADSPTARRHTSSFSSPAVFAFEHRPQRVRQGGEDQMYPVAVRKTIQLCCGPQVCGLLSQDGQARLPHELVRYLAPTVCKKLAMRQPFVLFQRPYISKTLLTRRI